MAYGRDGYRRAAKAGTARDAVADTVSDRLEALGYGDQAPTVLEAAERQLRDGGIGVDIDVRGLSRLWASVDWYLDLGVLQEDTRRTRLSPGRKNLLPDNLLASVQTQLRNNLYKHSFPVGVLGSYRYIPNEAFLEWKAAHDELVDRFNAIRDGYIDRYDELVAALEADYAEMAQETWDALRARGTEAEKQFTRDYTLGQFTLAVVNKAKDKLPSAEEMRREIRVVVSVATWMLPVEAAQDALEHERLVATEQAEREEREWWVREERMRREAMEQEWKALDEESRARQQAAMAEQELIRIEQRERAQAIRNAQIELARASIMDLANPMDEMLNGLRERMYQSAHKVLANVEKHGRVVGKQVEAIENMVAMFRMLNAAGDAELEHEIERLAESLHVEGVTHKRDTMAIKTALAGVAQVAMEQAETTIDMTRFTELDVLAI